MSHIPKDASWYIAELIERVSVAGDPRLVVHRNLRLIRADSPEAAYTKALALGSEGETTYLNPAGQQVSIEFLGLADLSVIYDPLEDGAEIAYTRYIVGSRQESEQFVRNRNDLTVFAQVPPADGPDYSAKDVVAMLNKPLDG
ncbi:DUF4288 domain-containing protein [Haliangium sp. UPWRP_2]|uniref:DUF4288 domain-containing protein n=1 Tax=Haliangium sp. UPWRP_2 TaxID=1931276 RepID=UPI000D0E1890|nr:DUF4288 domain-containing protein [Haliangium sp. UPWRP_2]PSM30698.1 hypothetical protein BVG81_009185 [Haliangium sp. UPWRP_2]